MYASQGLHFCPAVRKSVRILTTGGPFAEWCGLNTYADHQERKKASRWDDIGGILREEQWTTEGARIALGLPKHGTDLTTKAINDAFKSLAKQHHPDLGGTAEQMTRINEAKKRLMLGVS